MKVMTGTQHLRVGVALFIGAALVGCGPDTPPAPPPPKVEIKPAPAPVVVPKPVPKPAAAAPAPARQETRFEKEGWKLLGQQQADRTRDRDRVVVGADKGAFREIQITVEGAALDVESMVVTFNNGEQYKPALRHSFKAGSRSRAIDFPGETRRIQHVDFVYRSVGTAQQDKANITIYGR